MDELHQAVKHHDSRRWTITAEDRATYRRATAPWYGIVRKIATPAPGSLHTWHAAIIDRSTDTAQLALTAVTAAEAIEWVTRH